VIEVTSPDPDGAGSQTASVTAFTYDAVGNLLTVTDPLSHVTEYEYDAHDNRTKIIDAELGETTFAYDDVGNLLSLTDPVGNTTTWVYDDLDRTIEETNELNKTRTFEYDAANNLTKRTDRNGRVIEFVYDDLHRRTNELWKNGSSTVRTLSWQYDALGRVTNSSDPAAEFDYTYDNLGRRTSVLHDLAGLSFDVELMSEYDAVGNRTALKALVDSAADFWNEYYYDALHRMTGIEQHSAALPGAAAVADKRIDFTYDTASQWDTITRYEDLIGSALVATSTYTHDNAGRLTALTHAQNTNVLANYDWAYDVANRITSFTNGLYSSESATYSYDDTNQLTGGDRFGTSNDESYSYDANGNRTMTGYSTGTNNQLTSDGVYNYEYDDEGNRTKRILLISGSPTGATTEYAWDHRNRLTKVTERTSPTGSNTAIYDYVYDLWGRRVAKLLDTDGDSDYDEETHYILDGERHERGNAGDHIVLTFDANEDLTNRYLHGPAVDQILADEQIDDVSGTTVAGEVLWPLTDNLGTVRDIASYDSTTDTTTVVNHIDFDSYGNLASQSNATVDHLFAYTGRERDDESGLHAFRARFYDSFAGSFISADLVGFLGRDTNLSRYVGNRVTSSLDPSGLRPLTDAEQQLIEFIWSILDEISVQMDSPDIDDYLYDNLSELWDQIYADLRRINRGIASAPIRPSKASLYGTMTLRAGAASSTDGPAPFADGAAILSWFVGAALIAVFIKEGEDFTFHLSIQVAYVESRLSNILTANVSDGDEIGREQGDRMTSKDDPIQQLDEIEEAQRLSREGKIKKIIEKIDKSKQRVKNYLRDIRCIDDLEDLRYRHAG
jgi:RHS repeat-associated protein